MTTRLPLHDE